MSTDTLPHAQQIRAKYNVLQARYPALRLHHAALALGISEMELLAAGAGGVQPTLLASSPQTVLETLETVGEVVALTRNDWCIQERHAYYKNVQAGSSMGAVLSPDVDLRMFFNHWGSVWAVNDKGANSIQFFDHGGTVIHKVIATDYTDMNAWQALVGQFMTHNPSWPTVKVPPYGPSDHTAPASLRDQWLSVNDTNELDTLLNALGLQRLTALRNVGSDLAQQIDNVLLEHMLKDVIRQQIPCTCTVGNQGIAQTHSGLVSSLKLRASWMSIPDRHFRLHVDTAAIAQTWVVNHPSRNGWQTLFECFAATGDLILRFASAPWRGAPKRLAWRDLMMAFCPEPLAA